jgi:anti-sigma factor RsiW
MSGRDCIEEILISAYLDGELAGDELRTVETHLAACRECRAAFESMKSDRNILLEYLPGENPPERLKSQLFRRIDAVEIRRADRASWLKLGQVFSLKSKAWAYACASVVFVAVIMSALEVQRRLENSRLLAEIDRSRVEWVARDSQVNPFDIKGARLQVAAGNPFKSYLNER